MTDRYDPSGEGRYEPWAGDPTAEPDYRYSPPPPFSPPDQPTGGQPEAHATAQYPAVPPPSGQYPTAQYPVVPPASGPYPGRYPQGAAAPAPAGYYGAQYNTQYPAQYQAYQGAPVYGYRPPAPTNGIGIGGFVCGLLGLLLFFIPFLGLILAIAGIAMSGVGMSAGRREGSNTGLAIAGLVLGIIALVPGLFWLLFAVSY